MQRRPIPPFTRDTALEKVKDDEKTWNTHDPKIITQAHAPDCTWRNHEEMFHGRAAIEYFLKRKWTTELPCGLSRELWTYTGNRISVRFVDEWQHAITGQFYRRNGNEHWEFNADGYVVHRDTSANEIPIRTSDRRL